MPMKQNKSCHINWQRWLYEKCLWIRFQKADNLIQPKSSVITRRFPHKIDNSIMYRRVARVANHLQILDFPKSEDV